MNKSFGAANDDSTLKLLEDVFRPEDTILKQIRVNSDESGLPHIHVGPFDGLHLEVLTRAFNAKRIVEIGTLGGYSGTCLLRGGGADAKLYTFEVSSKNADVARKNFQMAGVLNQVEIFEGPAIENLHKIEKCGTFDLVFIDADKNSYPDYLNWAYKNLRKGGVVLGDNTLAWGLIARNDIVDDRERKQVMNLRRFNEICAQDGRFRSTMLPTGEGLTMAVKK